MIGRRSRFHFSPLESTTEHPAWIEARRRAGDRPQLLDPLPSFIWSVFWRAFSWTFLPGIVLLAAASWVR